MAPPSGVALPSDTHPQPYGPLSGDQIIIAKTLLLTVGLLRRDARAVRDQQVHHRVPRYVHGGRRHHVTEGDGAAGSHVGCDGAGRALVVCVGAHVTLELGGRFAVDPAQLADEDAAGAGAPKPAGTVLPFLAVVLLGVDPQVRQRREG